MTTFAFGDARQYPVILDGEETSTGRLLLMPSPGLRPGRRIRVKLDGRWPEAEVVRIDASVVHLRLVRR